MSNIIETHIFAEIHWSARYFSILHYTIVAIHSPQRRPLSSGEDTDCKLHQLVYLELQMSLNYKVFN